MRVHKVAVRPGDEGFAWSDLCDLDGEGSPLAERCRCALLALVDQLLGDGYSVMPDPDPAAFRSVVQSLGERGLDVAMTELDVRVVGDAPDGFDVQADWYTTMVGACLGVPAGREVTVWGFTDRFDWQDDIFAPGTSKFHIFVHGGGCPWLPRVPVVAEPR